MADPVSAILGMLVADKISPSSEKKPSGNHTSWRELLTTNEEQVLSRLEQDPVIQSCARLADDGDAIAAYHMRKIANFGLQLDTYIKNNGSVPMLRSMNYQWPAKGMQWCQQKYGQQSVDSELSLQAAALDLTSLVQGLSARQSVVVAKQP